MSKKETYRFTEGGLFRPARAGAEFLKLSASPFYFIEPRRSQRRGLFSPCPRTPKGLPFLVGRKGSKRPFKRGVAPLKDSPRGSALAASPDPTAGFLGGGSKLIESQEVRSFAGKCCTLLGFPRIAQLPGKLFRLFRARAVRKPRSVTPLYFALTGRRGCPAWACGPMLTCVDP